MEGGGQRRIFISYAHGAADDESLCSKLAKALLAKGYHVFFDGDLRFGIKWDQQIESEIARCDLFSLLLSERALGKAWAFAKGKVSSWIERVLLFE
jgi:hypothetical protein